MATREVETKNYVIRAEQILSSDDESKIIEIEGLLVQVCNIMNKLRDSKVQINFNINEQNKRYVLTLSATKTLL